MRLVGVTLYIYVICRCVCEWVLGCECVDGFVSECMGIRISGVWWE